jgi:hypothetical protein
VTTFVSLKLSSVSRTAPRYRDARLPLGYGTDEYTASKRELAVLLNGYVDLGSRTAPTPAPRNGVRPYQLPRST